MSQAVLTTVCDNQNTCNPSFCVKVPNPACTTPANRTDVDISSMITRDQTCRTCTRSADVRCSKENLTKMFYKYPGVKKAFCNEDFLVIDSNSLANHPTFLDWIQRPPGSAQSGATYDQQCVTRGQSLNLLVFKVPLNPTALPTSTAAQNNVNAFPSAADGLHQFGFSMPVSGPVAAALNGIALFPAPNNGGTISWLACEMDRCNAHVGQGYDYHYHGDPFQCMYSADDYIGGTGAGTHPPLTGFGLDGFSVYGRYLTDAAVGATIALDDCGGHTHEITEFGVTKTVFHYHAQVFASTVTSGPNAGQPYTAYIGGPYKCWKGDISKITNFWTGGNPTQQASYGAGNLKTRPDFFQVQPCCNSADVYNIGDLPPAASATPATGAVTPNATLVGSASSLSKSTNLCAVAALLIALLFV